MQSSVLLQIAAIIWQFICQILAWLPVFTTKWGCQLCFGNYWKFTLMKRGYLKKIYRSFPLAPQFVFSQKKNAKDNVISSMMHISSLMHIEQWEVWTYINKW